MNRSRTTKSEPAPPEHKPGRDSVEPSRRDAVSDWLDLFVRLLGLPASESAQVRDELEDHLRSRVDDLLITGASEPEAVRLAVAELGETASLAQGFKQARRNPRRRYAMHAALFIVAGSALVLSSTALFTGGNNATPAGSGVAAVEMAEGSSTGSAAVSTDSDDRFGETLRKYDVRGLVFAEAPLETTDEGSDLMDTITTLVGYEDWQRNGGDDGQLHLVGNTLFVNAPSELQKGVEWVIEALLEDAEKLHAEQEMQEQAEIEEEMRQREEEVQAYQMRVDELRANYEQLRERLVELSRREVLASFQQQANQSELVNSEDENSEAIRNAFAEAAAQETLINIEQEDVELRISRVRQVLIDMEMRAVMAGIETR